MTLRLGDQVGDLTFVGACGEPVGLNASLGRPLLLVFLRHLA